MTLSGVRVLLAEDNPTNQMVATQMLESLGAEVTLARDGAEALEILEGGDFDVMLVDIEMPRVSGIDVIRRVRAFSGPRAELPMIALTAYVMREHRAAIDAAGANGVIAKPILSIEQFGADVRQLMGDRAPPLETAPGAGAAAPSGDAPPVVDRAVYDTLAETIGAGAMSELLEKVDADVRSARDRLKLALESGDLESMRSASHVLISVAGAVGAVHVQEGARRLNAAADHGDRAAVEEAAPIVLGEIERMLAFVAEQPAR